MGIWSRDYIDCVRVWILLLSSEYSCYNQSRDLHPDLFSLEEGKAFCLELLWLGKHVSYKLQSLVMLWFEWNLFLSCCDRFSYLSTKEVALPPYVCLTHLLSFQNGNICIVLYKYHLKLKYLLNVMYIVFFRLFYKRNMKPKYWWITALSLRVTACEFQRK